MRATDEVRRSVKQNFHLTNRHGIEESSGMKHSLTLCGLAVLLAACSNQPESLNRSWNRKKAAAYLDRREAEWRAWPQAARGQGTFCVSCHTALPYALARPVLTSTAGEQIASVEERVLLEDVRQRVRLWPKDEPYYSSMEQESRGTEAVLNALILADHDSLSGSMGADTRSAFDHMWATQQSQGDNKGAWPWQVFNTQPWEAEDSLYYGACLAAVAVGIAPENYRANPAIQDNLELLRQYLKGHYAAQTAVNRIGLIWASQYLAGLITSEQQRSLIEEIVSKQQPDGGWSLSTLVGTWKREDGTPLVLKSDGFATGYIAFVLQKAGLSNDDHVRRGLSWLASHQNWWNGGWSGYSLNKRRHNPFSQQSRFMDDAATAYAVLALTEARNASSGQAMSASKRAEIPHSFLVRRIEPRISSQRSHSPW